jgi:hypothetical protein
MTPVKREAPERTATAAELAAERARIERLNAAARKPSAPALGEAELAVIRRALDDGNRYYQLRWSMCSNCAPGRLCANHEPGDAVARAYRDLAARLALR